MVIVSTEGTCAYCTGGVILYKWACCWMKAVGSGLRPLFQYTLCQRLSWWPDICCCSALPAWQCVGRCLLWLLSHIFCNKKDTQWFFLTSVSFFSSLHLVLSFSSPLFSSFVPVDSLFFNAPFLDFKSIFHPSCYDGKCNVKSASVLTRIAANNTSERKKERLSDWPFPLNGNMLEWSGTLWPSVSHTRQPSVKWQTRMFFFLFVCFVSLV